METSPGTRGWLAAAIGGLLLVTGAGGAGTVPLAAAESASAPVLRPGATSKARLQSLPVNTWIRYPGVSIKVNSAPPPVPGSGQVAWCYDSNARRFVHIGGTTDACSDEIWTYNLDGQNWCGEIRPTTAGEKPSADHPGRGGNRGLCYDPDNKCMWLWGGAAAGPLDGTRGLWRASGGYAPANWKHFEQPRDAEQAMIACDRGAKRLVMVSGAWINPRAGTTRVVLVDPKTAAVETVTPAAPADSPLPAAARGKADGSWGRGGDCSPLVYVPELKGVLYLGSFPSSGAEAAKDREAAMVTWLFDCGTKAWKDLRPAGSPPWREGHAASYDSKNGVVLVCGGCDAGRRRLSETWVYLPRENRWADMKPKGVPEGGFEAVDGPMLPAYDEERDLHIFGLPMSRGRGTMWVYRFGNPPAAEAPKETPAGK